MKGIELNWTIATGTIMKRVFRNELVREKGIS